MGFIKAFDKIRDFFEKHGNKIPILSAIIGAVLWFIGLFTSNKAKNNDDEAKRIIEESIRKYNESEGKTIQALEKLGNLQRDVCETFPRLTSAIEKINKSQRGLLKRIKRQELSKKEIEELTEISNLVRAAIEGAGGTGGGVLIGMAAFGVNPAALGPGAFLGGVVICAKGVRLLKSSHDNLRKANETQKTVEEIVQYHSELRNATESMFQAMSKLYAVYIDYLVKLETIANNINGKNKANAEEELIIKNAARIVKILNRMCKVQLILKPKKENEMETVNTKEVERLVKESKDLLVAV